MNIESVILIYNMDCKARGLRPTEHHVLGYLAVAENAKTCQCNPGIGTIMKHTGLSRMSVIRAIKGLEEKGYITVVRSNTPNSGRLSNGYILNVTDAALTSATETLPSATETLVPSTTEILPSTTEILPSTTETLGGSITEILPSTTEILGGSITEIPEIYNNRNIERNKRQPRSGCGTLYNQRKAGSGKYKNFARPSSGVESLPDMPSITEGDLIS